MSNAFNMLVEFICSLVLKFCFVFLLKQALYSLVWPRTQFVDNTSLYFAEIFLIYLLGALTADLC